MPHATCWHDFTGRETGWRSPGLVWPCHVRCHVTICPQDHAAGLAGVTLLRLSSALSVWAGVYLLRVQVAATPPDAARQRAGLLAAPQPEGAGAPMHPLLLSECSFSVQLFSQAGTSCHHTRPARYPGGCSRGMSKSGRRWSRRWRAPPRPRLQLFRHSCLDCPLKKCLLLCSGVAVCMAP